MKDTEVDYPEELNKRFVHNSWFASAKKTTAFALDFFAQTSDFVLAQKKSKIQTGHLLDPYQYDDTLEYIGKEGGFYRLSATEKLFYLQRKEYWKKGEIGEIKYNLDKTEFYISVLKYGNYIGWGNDGEFKGIDELPYGYSRSEVLKLLKEDKITPKIASNALLPETQKWFFAKLTIDTVDGIMEVKRLLGRTEYDLDLLLSGLYYFNYDRKTEKWIE